MFSYNNNENDAVVSQKEENSYLEKTIDDGKSKKKRASTGKLLVVIYILIITLVAQTLVISGVFHTCDIKERVIVKQTCDTAGTIEKYCEKCGYIEKIVIPAEGHAWVSTGVKKTYTSGGIEEEKCSTCSQIREKTLWKSFLPNSNGYAVNKYFGVKAQTIFNEYGKNFYVGGLHQRLYFSYKDCPYYFIFKDYSYSRKTFVENLNRSPSGEDQIIGLSSDIKGTEIFKGIKIGDNINLVKNQFGIDYIDNSKLSAVTYNDGYMINWHISLENTIIFAEVLKY